MCNRCATFSEQSAVIVDEFLFNFNASFIRRNQNQNLLICLVHSCDNQKFNFNFIIRVNTRTHMTRNEFST
jgi:hypothetical protein